MLCINPFPISNYDKKGLHFLYHYKKLILLIQNIYIFRSFCMMIIALCVVSYLFIYSGFLIILF